MSKIMSTKDYSALSRPMLLAVVAIIAAAPAQAASPDSGQLLNEQQQRQMRMPDRLPQDFTEPTTPEPAKEGRQILVKGFRFVGTEGLATDDELNEVVASAVGKHLTLAQLQSVANSVTAYLRSKGWPLARAYVPPQDVTNGIIEIAVMRGRVEKRGAVIGGNESRLSRSFAKEVVDGALQSGDESPTEEELERGVLLLNDLPGISAKSTLEKGEEPNTTRLGVELAEGPWVSGYVSGDNYGNRYTGSRRGATAASLNDPLGIGDQLAVTGTIADGLWLKQFGYSLPLASNGLRLSTSYTTMHYKIGKDMSNLDNSGRAETFDGKLSYPVVRSRKLSVYANAGYAYKKLTDKSAALVTSDRRVAVWSPSVQTTSYDSLGGGGLTTTMLSANIGRLDRSRVESDQTTDMGSANSAGRFNKMNYSLARLQNLTSDFALFAAINGQFTDKNLDSSEKFILGGPSGIRAYPVGEASGDVGWLTNVELRYDVPVEWSIGNIQLVAFYDAGGVQLNRSRWDGAVTTATGRNYYNLSGAGLGINVTKSQWYALRTSWAHGIGSNPGESTAGNNSDGKNDNNQFWMQGIFYF